MTTIPNIASKILCAIHGYFSNWGVALQMEAGKIVKKIIYNPVYTAIPGVSLKTN